MPTNERMESQGAGPKGQSVPNAVQQTSPNNQAPGGADSEDYPGGGPLPLGQAPLGNAPGTFPTPDTMPMGVDVNQGIAGNPNAIPNANAGGPSSTANIGQNKGNGSLGAQPSATANPQQTTSGGSSE